MDKRNCRPITVLCALSKVLERLLYSQMAGFADTYLVPYSDTYICRYGFADTFDACTLAES